MTTPIRSRIAASVLMLAFTGAILATLALHPRTTTIDAATEAPVTQPIRSEGMATSADVTAPAPPPSTGATTYAAKATAWPSTTVAWTVPPQSQYTGPSSTTATTAKPAATTATTAARYIPPPTTAAPYIPPPTTAPYIPPTTAPSGGSGSDWAFLACVKQRESGGNYSINTGNGYYGAYQFAASTWNSTASHAGRGDLVGVLPNLASPADQDAMALSLLQWAGRSPWAGYGC